MELESAGGSQPGVPASTVKDEEEAEVDTAPDVTTIGFDVALMIAIAATEGVVTAGGMQPAVSANTALPAPTMPAVPPSLPAMPVPAMSTLPAVPAAIDDGKGAHVSNMKLGPGKSATDALKPATQGPTVDTTGNVAAGEIATAATAMMETGAIAFPFAAVHDKSAKPAGGTSSDSTNASVTARQDMPLPGLTPADPPTAGARQPANSPLPSAISGRAERHAQPASTAESPAPSASARTTPPAVEASARPSADLPQLTSQELLSPASIAVTASGQSGIAHTGNTVMPIILVPTHVENPGWTKDFGQHVIRLAVEGQPAAEIHLNPPDLGPIRVSIEMKGQDATLQFVAAHPQTREALEGSMPRLREIFAGSNITLASADVASKTFSDQSFGSNGQRFPQPTAAELTSQNSRTARIDDTAPVSAIASRPPASRSRVDLFA